MAEPNYVLVTESERAELFALRATVDRVRALLVERQAGKFWFVRIADVTAALDAQRPAEGGPERIRLKPWSYREPANNVTLHVNDQGPDGIAFVASPKREATEPYEQYGVVVPRDRARELAQAILAALDSTTPPPSPEGETRAMRRRVQSAATELLRREMQHIGHGRDGHLNEDDIAIIYAALDGGQPDTPAPPAEPATDIYGRSCTVYMAPEGCTDPYRCRVHRGAYPAPAPTRLPMCPACEIEHAPPMHYDAAPAPTRSGEEER